MTGENKILLTNEKTLSLCLWPESTDISPQYQHQYQHLVSHQKFKA
jgi:hypothetical protein